MQNDGVAVLQESPPGQVSFISLNPTFHAFPCNV